MWVSKVVKQGKNNVQDEESTEQVKLITPTTSDVPYGSTEEDKKDDENGDTTLDYDDDDDEDDDDMDALAGMKSFHLGATKMHASNVWTSMRFTDSFAEHGDEYEMVPSLLKENFALLLDPNLNFQDKGRVYYAESAFYRMGQDPHYALTVNCDIYQRVVKEINDSKSVPCGLYFCCHGGDGAVHTGVSHDDYVDIRVAYLLTGTLFVVMIVLAAYDI